MPARPPDSAIAALSEARLHAPESILGRHCSGAAEIVRAFLPEARQAWVEPGTLTMKHLGGGLFEWRGGQHRLTLPYHLRWQDAAGREHQTVDPYQFAPQLAHDDMAAFNAGTHRHAYRMLGAHVLDREGAHGTRFAVWAPNATRVSVVGDFNDWDGRRHPLSVRGGTGIWELFVPGIEAGAFYKYEIRDRAGHVQLKSDPFAVRFETRPRTASVVCAPSGFEWTDAAWLRTRPDWQQAAMAIYEIHAGSWQRSPDGGATNWKMLAAKLISYLKETGFTHVELMPVMEHPLDESWGYQCTGYFAPTSRFGRPDDFRHFVNAMHEAGIGVILDWVPGHFPRDEHALAQFDGTALFEHADPRRANTAEWDTLAFNLARHEVRSFLISSAMYWLEEFHIDGLRVDAVASMLYLDYGRRQGEWLPNAYGGNEDLDAVSFLQALNTATHGECPDSFTIAEESTAWPGVTRPVHLGGLGFSMKWNMGWMHDTLDYFHHDSVHRRYHHDRLTFGMLYAFSENHVLPLSHDEVVHGKGSLYARMPGDDWQKHANLRLLFAFQYAWPGKKLIFMGDEIGAHDEFAPNAAPDWKLLGWPRHAGLKHLVADLNMLYRTNPALHAGDFHMHGFEWIDCHDADNSVISFMRRHGDMQAIAVLNFTPVPRHEYRIGVDRPGFYRELINTDAAIYGGSNLGNAGGVRAEEGAWMNRHCSISLSLPPLGALFLCCEDARG